MTQPQDGVTAPPPGVTAALPPAVLPVTKETLLVVEKVQLPAVLVGKKNGQLPASILDSIAGLSGGPTVTLVPPALRAWAAMAADAKTHGIILQATSTADSYRTLDVQTRIFHQRYVAIRQAGWVTRKCGSTTYYQVPGTASAACPGTSNHGLGLAIDVANASGGRLTWMISNVKKFGFSWEIQSESWHIRYVAGDHIPAAVLAYEEEDMPITDADAVKIARAVHSQIIGRSTVTIAQALQATMQLATTIAAKVDIDPAELAAITAAAKAGTIESADAIAAAVVARLPATALTPDHVAEAVRTVFLDGETA